MGLGIASGFAYSVQVRCICFLLIPTFFGKAGRSYIGTFAIAFLILGKLSTILHRGSNMSAHGFMFIEYIKRAGESNNNDTHMFPIRAATNIAQAV